MIDHAIAPTLSTSDSLVHLAVGNGLWMFTRTFGMGSMFLGLLD